MGNVMWSAVMELWISNQLVLRPTAIELVCACRRQPMWSAGQDTMRHCEAVHGTMCSKESVGGEVLTTRRVPSVARVLVFHASPGPGLAGSSAANVPR